MITASAIGERAWVADPERSRLGPAAIDALSVRAGLRLAGRFTGVRSAVAELEAELRDLGLETAVRAADGSGYRYLSTGEQRALAQQPRAHLLFARTGSVVRDLVAAHDDGDNRVIGELLGYPPCCIEANELFGFTRMNDYVRVARVSGAADHRLNIFLASLPMPCGSPYVLTPHFPCTLMCRPSIEQAQDRMDVLGAVAPEFARRLDSMLRLPVLLHDDTHIDAGAKTGLNGAALNGIAVGSAVVYRDWFDLRRPTGLSAALSRATVVDRIDEGLVLRADGGDEVASLPADRWILTTFGP